MGKEAGLESVIAGHVQELRRGTVVVACLAALSEPMYGYQLLEVLASRGVEVEGNTLYPLLRRLAAQSLLASEWDTAESRPRKFYATTDAGELVLQRLVLEWRALDAVIGAVADVEPGGDAP